MTDTQTNDHPICNMCDNSKQLREQAMFAKKQAHNSVERAKKANTDIANLDIEGTFAQLHQLVAMVGGKSRHTQKQATARTDLSLAAE